LEDFELEVGTAGKKEVVLVLNWPGAKLDPNMLFEDAGAKGPGEGANPVDPPNGTVPNRLGKGAVCANVGDPPNGLGEGAVDANAEDANAEDPPDGAVPNGLGEGAVDANAEDPPDGAVPNGLGDGAAVDPPKRLDT